MTVLWSVNSVFTSTSIPLVKGLFEKIQSKICSPLVPVLTNCSSPCSSQNSTHFSADIVLTPVSITFPPALLYNSSICKSPQQPISTKLKSPMTVISPLSPAIHSHCITLQQLLSNHLKK